MFNEEEDSMSDLDIWNSDTRSKVEQSDFKKSVVTFYGRKGFWFGKQIKYMITNEWYPPTKVCASHIWKWCERGRHLIRFGLEPADRDSPRNGLLKHIGEQFDNKNVCFLFNPLDSSARAICKVLNPALLNEPIKESNSLKFCDIDGKTLQHKTGKNPFRRILKFHAKCSYKNALSKGWITQDVYNQFTDFDKLSADAIDSLQIYHYKH